MHLNHTHSPRIGHVILLSFAILLLFYAVYHFMNGRRGWFAWQNLQVTIMEAEQNLASLHKKQQGMQERMALLGVKTADADLVDELARSMLGYGEAGEVVIVYAGPQVDRVPAHRLEKQQAMLGLGSLR